MNALERIKQAEWRLRLAHEDAPSGWHIVLLGRKRGSLHARITLRGAEAELRAANAAMRAEIEARNAAFRADMDSMTFDEKAHYFGD